MTKSSRDYYEVLEVSRSADQKTIKRAFLKKARVLHPDVCREADAEKNFKELNEAYSVLSDEKKRAHYDMFGTMDGASFASGSVQDIFSGMGFADIFSDIFGEAATAHGPMGGASFRGRRPSTPTDEDLRIQMNLTLADILAGKEEVVEIPKTVSCPVCAGTGSSTQKDPSACDTCHGYGQVRARQQTPFGVMDLQTACPDCGGSGIHIEDPCPECHATGRITKTQTVKVQITGEDLTKPASQKDSVTG